MLVILQQLGGNDNASRVMESCRKIGADYVCLNADDVAGEYARMWDGGEHRIIGNIGGVDITQIKSVFNGVFADIGRSIGSKNPKEYAGFIYQEFHDILFGSLLSLDDVKWMNHPQSVMMANLKTLQLSVASKIGFVIPETIISKNREVLTDFFIRMNGNVVTKAIHMGNIAYNGNNQHVLLYTSKVSEESLNALQENSDIPVLLQEYISDKEELRIVVVGEEVFSCSVNSDTESVDWRMSHEAVQNSFVINLPYHIKEKCKDLIKHFGLSFGVIDMVRNKSTNEYYFLEINQQGTWNWMEELLGLPIGDSIVNLLYA